MTEESLVFECDLEAPPDKVWRALAEPELRAEWLDEPADCQVLEQQAGERLSLGWPEEGLETTVTFEIEPAEGGGSHLTIVHTARLVAQVVPFPSRPQTTMSADWRLAA